ncbi:MAG: hypothetical protein EKK40_00945 [Bradyrhizobiaceae bacterium]|nr:MAG: hypothetical protein EKK40_00945 [Bradyrhizobiaceae bacterium]
MNYAGPFASNISNDGPVSLTDHQFKLDSAGHLQGHAPADHDALIVPDAQLLFSSDFSRLGDDLILSNADRKFVVPDYFHGEKRAFLATPDGASLSGDVVDALTGHVQYAQAGPAPGAARDIGQVSKVVGSATVIRNGVVVELHNGDHVFKGDVVQAGVNSSCTITFVDGSVFGLSANARMLLNDMVYDQAGASNSALISLVRGTISFVAGETAKHGDMKVETPVATMGIRGTAVLVEIGFEIPSDGKSPPVNFQVLVEPDGTTGSYIVYSKSDPSVILGTVNKAGQVYSVSGDGTFSNLPSTEMSQVAATIIQQVFTQRFPSYVPTTPQSGGGAGSTPPTPPGSDVPQHHDDPGNSGNPTTIPITINVPDGNGGTKTTTVPVGVSVVDVAPTITGVTLSVFKNAPTLLTPSNVTVVDPDNSSFTFSVTNLAHGHFEIKSGIESWATTTTFTTADILLGHVRFVADGEGAPTFTLTANDGHLSSTPVNVVVAAPPAIDGVSFSVFPGGITVLDSSSIYVSDLDSSVFTFHVSNVEGGEFQTTTDGIHWSDADTFTSTDLTDGHVRFVSDGGESTPSFKITAEDDTHLTSSTFDATVGVSTTEHLTNDAGVSIDVSDAGATSGFTFPGAGNVTTPGTPEDRIALGYHIGESPCAIVHNSAPLEGVDQFGHLGATVDIGTNTVTTNLDAGNHVTLTQTVTLGADANYFTTTIKIANDGDTAINDVSFLRNIDPDQDVAVNGNYQTFNQVLQNPDSDEHVAAVSATGPTSGVNVVLVGLGDDWHATFYGSGLTHSDPYDPDAFGQTPDPTTSDQSITLIDNVGTIAAHSSVEITYLTTANVATNGDNALIGTSGNDTIDGLGGNDLLIGLGGADNFVFAKGSGNDTILDFKPGTDTIELDGLMSAPQTTDANDHPSTTDFNTWKASAFETVGNDLLIHLDGHDTVLLKNVTSASLTANDFIIHPGTSA